MFTFAPLYSMPLSFMPTEAPSGVLKRSSAVFRLSLPPRSSSVTVQANTGAIWRFEACCTALAVTARTAPLKNSMSSWPVTLRDKFSSTIVRMTSSSSESFGIVSSMLGSGIRPERPAGIAVSEKPPVSGPHLDLRFLGPSGDLERFFFLSFLPLEADLFSFLILSFFFSSFFFFLSFGDRDRSLFISLFKPSSALSCSCFASAYKSPSFLLPSPFATSPFASLLAASRFISSSCSSFLSSRFTCCVSTFKLPVSFLTVSFLTASCSSFAWSVFSALTLTSSFTVGCSKISSSFTGCSVGFAATPPAKTGSSGSSAFSCLTFTGGSRPEAPSAIASRRPPKTPAAAGAPCTPGHRRADPAGRPTPRGLA
mmetsp:Transcript_118225/g.329726  ORF Transcript_118225/g.329726 Transcript_118225/m.329726 type:complete len:369 (-) Transcript_118225:14-1120(-)